MNIESKFHKCMDVVLRHEGGLVDDKQDPGGLTNFGISKAAHPEMSDDNIRTLTRTQAILIYEADYWKPIKGDELPYPLALVTFDSAVNSGIHRASKWLQEVVEVPDDGKIGPQTIAASLECDPAQACRAYTDLRLAFLRSLPTWERFGRGWESRCLDTLREALA